MSQGDFHSLVNRILGQYDQLVKENNELKAQIASLQAQLASQTPKIVIPEKSSTPVKKGSIPFWQSKSKITVDWKPVPIDFSDSVLCSHYSTDEIIAFGTVDASIHLFSPQNMTSLGSVVGHKGAINCIVSDPSTKLFASCSGDHTINIWSNKLVDSHFPTSRRSSFETDKFTASTVLSHHTGPVHSATWILGDGRLVTGSSDNKICFWDVTHSTTITRFEDVKSSVLCLDTAPDGLSISFSAGLSSGSVYFFDHRTGSGPALTLLHCKGQCVGTKFVKDDSTQVISAGTDSKVKQWDIRTLSEPIQVIEVDHVPTKIDIKNQFLVCPCETGKIRLINLKSGSVTLFEQAPFSYTISSASFLSEDASSMVVTSWDGSASIARFSLP